MERIDMTVSEIKETLKKLAEDDPLWDQLKLDPRKGVRQLVKSAEASREKKAKEIAEFTRMSIHEIELWNAGYDHIAGIDEVGRGPLAGPVVAAAVILPHDFHLPGLTDSKKVPERKREAFYTTIMEQSIAVGISIIGPEVIDEINIYEATKKAMSAAIADLSVKPDHLLIDAMPLTTPYPSRSIIKGDATSISIAAASIIAKVTRDRLMKEYAVTYPGYGFEKNAGYGTADHLKGLDQYGVTPIHRASFAPVKEKLI